MDYLQFMRKVDGRPEKVNPKFNPDHYYTGDLFDFDMIQNVIDGDDVDILYYSFTWRDTPQGHKYWGAIADGETLLLTEDRDYLEYLLREHS